METMESGFPRGLRVHRSLTIFVVVVVMLACDLIGYTSCGAVPIRGASLGGRKGRTWMEGNGGQDDHIVARQDAEKIVGGGRANRTAFPYVVMLSIVKDNEDYVCGGTLIDRQYVVTAAHCVLNSSVLVVPPKAITVYAGSTELKKGQKVSVTQVWSHPNFTFYANDVALLKLKSSLAITPTVMPIKLSNNDGPLTNGGDLTICGWGSMSASGTSASVNLMAASVDYLPNNCGKYKKPDTNEYVSSLMVCAGCTYGKVDTCQGDSGGPLTTISASKGCPILVGLTSFGEGCADPNYPGVYTRVSSQLAWLEKQAGRVFRSQYAMKPTQECDTCAGWNKGKCGLAPAFDGSACQIEGYLGSAFQLRLKTCSKSNRMAAGASLPVEALFNPASFGSFKPAGYVYFVRAQSEGSSTFQFEGVTVTLPLKGPVESRNGTAFQNYWRLFWLPDADAPNRTCSDYFAYAAVFISSDKKFIQVTSPVRSIHRT